jgi:hypothetical protein
LPANRGEIFAALKARLGAIPGLVTVSDRLKPWSSVSPDQQPALFITKAQEIPTNSRGMPPVWRMTARLYLYVHGLSIVNASPQEKINELLTLIEAALEVQPGETPDTTTPFATTLGGLVSHAWIDGAVETDEGTLGDQTVAILPVEMLTTA